MLAIRRLRLSQSGAAVIELALVVPVLAVAVVGIVDISNAFTRKLAIEQGAQRAVEKIMQTTQKSTVDDTLKTEAVCQVNGTNSDGSCKTSPITADDVTVSYRLECTASNGTITVKNGVAADADCASGETEAQYLSVNVKNTYTPLFRLYFSGLGSDGKYHVSATAGMRTQ
jgi:Flp pilus assembly protein TadG